ncbi:Bll2902 protein [hydrothermal vent metagenome]|uniref:Bll2902 protein n=1 Tax=hydrothermal vent metagenome TaxID=652676 RepID=A0A3B0S2V1_9ZZZZ
MNQKIEFKGSQGDKLAARLDSPATTPKAYALFAHCFTCSKDIFAASRISQALTAEGIAVLRFDFTGLGASQGEFANTNFSSNIDDLVLAADYLRENFQAPQLLIGHSLGGAAILAAAEKISETNAVVTIGAPADIEHVLENFGSSLEAVESKGEATVSLAGREFTIKSQFVKDVREQAQEQRIKNLKKPLLIFHSPIDQTVGIDNATKIFVAAKHPKSFVSLDQADHLLSRREDAIYVAEVLGAWVTRYLRPTEAAQPVAHDDLIVRVEETGQSKFQQKITSGQHQLLADEPASVGGADTGPSPYDYLSVALGACTTMTMRMYADHKGYDIGKLSVEVSHAKIHAKDCVDCVDGRTGRVDHFERAISVEGGVTAEIAEKLLKIADKCPVHKTLELSSVVATRMADKA